MTLPGAGCRMIIYLHGLNSSGDSRKAGLLRLALAPRPVLSPTYPAHRPREAVETLERFLRELNGARGDRKRWVLIGSSMGGFYGRYLAQRCAMDHLFLINPALHPWELFADFLGHTFTTASGEPYRVDRALLAATRDYAVEELAPEPPTTVFLDEGDEVIDFRVAQEVYRDRGRLYVFPGGDHAFGHLEQAVAVIRDTLDDLRDVTR